MPASMQTVSAILKEVYQPGINDQLNNEVMALKRVKRTSKGVDKVGGRDAYFAIHTTRNEGIGARNEMEKLPDAGQQGYARGHVGLKYQYGGVQISGQTFELASTDYQAFSNAVDEELKRLREDLAVDLNRQVYGDGTGKLVEVISASGNTIKVSNANGRNIRKGMEIDIFAAGGTGTAKAANRLVTGIDYDAGTITINGAAPTLAAGDIVVRAGNVNREWTGYDKIIRANGTLHDVDPAVEPLWKATVDSSGGEISELRMIEMVHKIRAEGGKTTVILTSQGLFRKYWQLLQGMRQIVNTQDFKGGYSGLGFVTENGEIPIVSDWTAPPGVMQFINEDEMRILQTHDWKFMDRDGGGMWQQVPGYDAYRAMLFQYSELATFRRNTHGKFTKLTES